MTDSQRSSRPHRPGRKKQNFLTRILTRHGRLVTLLGALIVFATFIVKDGLREDLRDLVDSVNSAQSIFSLQRENGLMSQRLTEIFRVVSATYTNALTLPPGGHPKIDVSTVGLHAQDAFDSVLRIQDELAAAERLLRSVSHEKDSDQRFAGLQVRYEDAARAYKVYIWPGSSTPQADVQKSLVRIVSIENTLWDVEADLAKFTDSFLNDASLRAEADEKSFQRVTWISYTLYAIGWAVALIGRLFGPKNDESLDIE